MKASKKLLSLLLAVVMVFAMVIPSLADEAPETPEPYAVPEDVAGKVVILHTNDVHGAVDGYAKVAALEKLFTDAGANVLVMDAGDFSQGTTYVSASEGATAVGLMNMVGYDVAAPGNHEFDYGYENLKTLVGAAEFPILAANVKYEGENAFGDRVILTAGDKKIGVFGLDTPETATKAHPAKIAGVTFAAGEEMFAIAQAEVDALKAENCDYIVCLGHLGIDGESVGNRSVDLLAKVTGINLFIDGHSHSTLADVQAMEEVTDGKVGETVITSTGTKLANVGVAILDGETITVESVAAERITVAEGDAIAARAQAIVEEIETEYGEIFAGTYELLDGNRDPGVRTQQTNLGTLICEAMVWFATKDGGLEVDDDHVVALTNGGGIRATIDVGPISKNDINTVLPFGNTVAIIYVTGEQLLEALEASTYCTPTAIGGYPQVSGIDFTIDTTKEFDAGENYPGTTYAKPNSINRVTINSINGKAFDPEATYAVVSNDFVAAGGDTYYAFSIAENVMDTGTPLDEALVQYITEELKGVIGEPTFTDVEATSWYAAPVDYAYSNGYMFGTEKGFEPNEELTYAETVQVLYNMAGSPAVENPALTDVEGKWYAAAANWANSIGLIEGDTFGDNHDITRGDARDLFIAYGETVEQDLSGVIQGDETGNLNLDSTLTRAQLAQMLLNASTASDQQ